MAAGFEGEADDLLRELFEASDAGMAIVGRDLRIQRMNRMLRERPRGDRTGMLVGEAFPFIAEAVTRFVESVFATGAPAPGATLEARVAPGTTKYWSVSFWPLRRGDEVVAVALRFSDASSRHRRELQRRDAEAQQRAEAELLLRESANRFRQLAENIGSAFWLMEADRSAVLYVSPAFELVFGIPVNSITESPQAFIDVVHPDDRARIVARLGGDQAVPYETEIRVLRPGGRVAWISIRTFPVRDETGAVARVAGIATDITAQRELEAQLLQAQKLDSLGRIAGGIAHDFNNLLTVVLNQTTMAERIAASGGAPREELAVIHDAARQGAEVVRQLLIFAKRQSLVPTPLVLVDLVDSVATFLRRIIGERIELVTELDDDIGVICADWAQLEQVLVNLALNARDAMPDGGTLTIRAGDLLLGTGGDGSEGGPVSSVNGRPVPPGPWVVLSVADTGRGIREEDRPRIFEPFFSTKPGSEGTGLGLASCYGTVKQHGGHMTVETAVGRGTTFTLYFPRSNPDQPCA